MLKSVTSYRDYFIIGLIGALFFVPLLGGVHLFDWDEINFAEISREMQILGNYWSPQIDYKPFWEKPPLFFWFQTLSMRIFGINEFAARFPNAICGVITLILLYYMGRKLHNRRFGWLWAGSYFGSILPFLYFKSGIIDPWFNLFIFLGIWFVIRFSWAKRGFQKPFSNHHKGLLIFLSGLFVSFGILTKGPVAYLIPVITMGVYWVFQRFRFFISGWDFIQFTFFASIMMLAWYGLETALHGPWFIIKFNTYQYRLFSTPDAGHGGFPGYHFVVLLLGVFPASIFAIRYFFGLPKATADYKNDFALWMAILFWVVLILFTIVQSKIVHYSSLSYFPMTYLAALVIEHILDEKIAFHRAMKIGLWVIGGIYIAALMALPYLGNHPQLLKPLLAADPFAVANLDAQVHWTFWQALPAFWLAGILAVFTYYLRKSDHFKSFSTLFLGMGVFVFLTLIMIIGRIERYSQGAAIEFYEAHAHEDCYIAPYGYYTYAHLFYAKKRPVTNTKSYHLSWLMDSDEVDKPTYIVAKINRLPNPDNANKLEEIGRKNGFVFYKRKEMMTMPKQ